MQPEVFLDGEPVQFSGPLPGTVGELHAVLAHEMARQDRVIAAVRIDGREWDDGFASEPVAAIRRFELSTISIQEAVAQLAAGLAADTAATRDRVDGLSSEVLQVPWPEAQRRCGELAERLSGVLEGITTLATQSAANAAAAADAASRLAGGVQAWMEAVRGADASAVTLRLVRDVLPALEGVMQAVGVEPPRPA